MVTPSTHDRVIEAVGKALEMINAISEARAETAIATAAANQIKSSSPVVAEAAAAQAKLAADKAAASDRFKTLEEVVSKPLEEARAVYGNKVSVAQQELARSHQESETECAARITASRHEQEMREASAQAEVHTAKQKASDLQVSMDNFCRQIQHQLGIDLKALIRGSE